MDSAVLRVKAVAVFLVAWLAAMLVWMFLLRSFLPHHSDNAAAQGLATLTS